VTPAEVLEKERARARRESLELSLLRPIRAHRLPEPLRQVRFATPRRWAFDFAWPEFMLACEVDGGTWSGGRHTRGAGYAADCEKMNEALILGWRVIRVTGAHIKSGAAVEWIRRGLDA